MDIPSHLLIFHPDTRMLMKTRRSMEKRSTMEHPRPSLDTFIGVLLTNANKNHGTGNLAGKKYIENRK